MTQMTNGDSVWKRTALEWQEKAERLREECDERQRDWLAMERRAEQAEAEVARLRAALEHINECYPEDNSAGETARETLKKEKSNNV